MISFDLTASQMSGQIDVPSSHSLVWLSYVTHLYSKVDPMF